MNKIMEDKTYIFKCGYKNGEHHCNGEHKFLLSHDFYTSLIYRMVFVYNLSVDKDILLLTIDKFNKYIEDRYVKNKTDFSEFSHFSSIDIDAELLMDFTEKEFGNNI
jgi:hypothetical protein